MKTVNSQIRVQQNSSNKNKETRTRCIIIQLLKTSNKEEIFKQPERKKYIYITWRTKDKQRADFQPKAMQARDSEATYLNTETKNCQHRILLKGGEDNLSNIKAE